MKIRPNPFGVTDYPDHVNDALLPGQVRWPMVSLQMHRKATSSTPNPKGPLVDGISHAHIQGRFPIWAELGAGPVTVPFTLLLFDTVGAITEIGAQFMGANGPMNFSECVVDQPLPFNGNPSGIVTVTGHITFDPALTMNGIRADSGDMVDAITRHGWFNTRILARVIFADGARGDLEAWIPYVSKLDTTLPEPVYGEGVMSFVAKAFLSVPGDSAAGLGLQLTEFRGTEGEVRGFVPILAPFSTPQTIYPFGYNYLALPKEFEEVYQLWLDGDLHMGVTGKLIDSTQMQLPNGQLSNVAVLDPTVIAASTPPMGVTPGMHRLIALWSVDTKDGTPDYKPNQRLVTVIVIEVEIGDNPTPPEMVVVPNVVGQTQSAATNTLMAAGLMLGSTNIVIDQTVPVGDVTRQFPAAGVSVVRGGTVNLMISAGGVPVDTETWVPAVPTFMQLHINGVPQPRWQICGVEDNLVMDNCVEIVTKP